MRVQKIFLSSEFPSYHSYMVNEVNTFLKEHPDARIVNIVSGHGGSKDHHRYSYLIVVEYNAE